MRQRIKGILFVGQENTAKPVGNLKVRDNLKVYKNLITLAPGTKLQQLAQSCLKQTTAENLALWPN